MNLKPTSILAGLSAAIFIALPAQATVTLYDQDFENPAAFVNDGGDVNIVNHVNVLYGNQPPGFSFKQFNTVETLLITGNQAFGHGYSDPSGQGGNYALGMLSSLQNDLLALSFNVGSSPFMNVRLDISSIDLSVFSGPFVPAGAVPTFEFTLYDNPGGLAGLGTGKILDVFQVSGTASAPDVFDWTEVSLPFDTTGNTNGNVILRIDLLDGGYAALDNFHITAGVSPIPEPETYVMLMTGLALMGFVARRKKRGQA